MGEKSKPVATVIDFAEYRKKTQVQRDHTADSKDELLSPLQIVEELLKDSKPVLQEVRTRQFSENIAHQKIEGDDNFQLNADSGGSQSIQGNGNTQITGLTIRIPASSDDVTQTQAWKELQEIAPPRALPVYKELLENSRAVSIRDVIVALTRKAIDVNKNNEIERKNVRSDYTFIVFFLVVITGSAFGGQLLFDITKDWRWLATAYMFAFGTFLVCLQYCVIPQATARRAHREFKDLKS